MKTLPIKQELKDRKIIRSELNIEKWPIFATSSFRGKSREISRTIITEEGKELSQSVVVGRIADKEVGVLRIFEMKGLYALIKRWEKAGKPIDKDVPFAIHEVAETLQREWGGATYKQICNMLDRLRYTPVKWCCSWKMKDSAEVFTIEDGFTILEHKQIFEKKRADQVEFSFSSFRFHKEILKNLIKNHTKPIYLDVVVGLKKEISVLLYRHVDLVMADKSYYTRRTKELFFDLGLNEYDYPSKRKQLLEPALKELEGVELSTGVLSQIRMKKTADSKDWKVMFIKSKRSVKIEHRPEEKKQKGEVKTVIECFNKRFQKNKGRLEEDMACRLIEKYSFDTVMLNISRISNKETVINPVGLLRASLKEKWDLPPTQEEILEEQRKTRNETERKKRAQEEQERLSYLKEKEKEEKLNKIFLNLQEEEQKILKDEAIEILKAEYPNVSQRFFASTVTSPAMVMIKVREILRKQREEFIAQSMKV